MLRRYIVLCLGWLLCVGIVKAQFDPQIGQYMFMQATYNPAAVGDGELMRVYGSHRMDFTGIDGAPMTTYFSFSSPFTIGFVFESKFVCGICLQIAIGQGVFEHRS